MNKTKPKQTRGIGRKGEPKKKVASKRIDADALKREELIQQCMTLRKKGLSFRAIEQQLIAYYREGDPEAGIQPDPNFRISYVTVGNYIQTGYSYLAEENKATAEQLRDMELARLDLLLEKLSPAIEIGDTHSIATALRVNESRRKLLGIDAAAKSTNINVDLAKLTDEQFLKFDKLVDDGVDPVSAYASCLT